MNGTKRDRLDNKPHRETADAGLRKEAPGVRDRDRANGS